MHAYVGPATSQPLPCRVTLKATSHISIRSWLLASRTRSPRCRPCADCAAPRTGERCVPRVTVCADGAAPGPGLCGRAPRSSFARTHGHLESSGRTANVRRTESGSSFRKRGRVTGLCPQGGCFLGGAVRKGTFVNFYMAFSLKRPAEFLQMAYLLFCLLGAYLFLYVKLEVCI